jgi:hypothetical protein
MTKEEFLKIKTDAYDDGYSDGFEDGLDENESLKKTNDKPDSYKEDSMTLEESEKERKRLAVALELACFRLSESDEYRNESPRDIRSGMLKLADKLKV